MFINKGGKMCMLDQMIFELKEYSSPVLLAILSPVE
jgi:hypothetical protein